ncbi:hypothetical protein BD408DRAFT_413722 [Parasitella parasitica]|nr:hypothetical protein BD408DRAFT_413722 [Parasitella parasitica]
MADIQFEQYFPIGFAENRCLLEEAVEFYVEWLDDALQFPDLPAASSLKSKDLAGGGWELIQRKELNNQPCIVQEDEGAWAKIYTSEQHSLYSQVAVKNADRLWPTKRTIRPLWPIHVAECEKKQNAIDKDKYQDNLGAELIDTYKSQSRRSNRMARLSQYHNLRTIDIHVEGVFRVATSRKGAIDVTWIPYDPSIPNVIVSHHIMHFNEHPKANMLRYVTKFKHNFKRYALVNARSSSSTKYRLAFPDAGEYSVHSSIIKKWQT